jgi:hypothetical protein
MVLNHIVVKEAAQVQLTKIGEGGFAIIYVGEIRYWYVYSSDGHEFMSINHSDNQSPTNMIHKYLAIKR